MARGWTEATARLHSGWYACTRCILGLLETLHSCGRSAALAVMPTALQFRLATWVFLKESCNEVILPLLEAAPRLNAEVMQRRHGQSFTVDASDDAIASFTIVSVPEHLAPLRTVASAYLRGDKAAQYELQPAALDSLVASLLPHVRLRGEDGHPLPSPPAQSCCAYYYCLMERGAYIPSAHWDTDWWMFPGAEAFQLWYHLENEDPANQGNMFLADCSSDVLTPGEPPCRLALLPNGAVRKLSHTARSTKGEETLREYPDVDAAGIAYSYLDMAPGECLVMSKRTMHMSDPRPHLRGICPTRLALNMRVILAQPGDDGSFTLPFQPDHPYVSMYPMHAELRRRAKPDGRGGFQIRVSRHEMTAVSGLFLSGAAVGMHPLDQHAGQCVMQQPSRPKRR